MKMTQCVSHLLVVSGQRLRRLFGARQRLAGRGQSRRPRQRLEFQLQPLHALEHVRQLCAEELNGFAGGQVKGTADA